MGKPIIAFDMDDVLADSTSYWRAEINRRTNANLTPEHYQVPGEYWGYYEQIWRTHKIDHLVSIPELDKQMVDDQSEISAYADALEVLTGLKKRFELVVVTARAIDQGPETHRWLDQNFPGLFSHAVFADGHAGITKKNKGEICKEIGAGWLVDDSPAHCLDAETNGVAPILFGQFGYHQKVHPSIPRCKDWTAIGAYFDGI